MTEYNFTSPPSRNSYWDAGTTAADIKTCKNCKRSIAPLERSPTGWSHCDPNWEGIRCAGDICGATPEMSPVGYDQFT